MSTPSTFSLRVRRPLRALALAPVLAACALPGASPSDPGAVAPAPPVASAPPELIASEVPPPRPDWNDEVDFEALRMAYGKREDFHDRCESGRRDAAEAFGRGEYARAAELSDPLLESCPVDAAAHLWRGASLFSEDRLDEAAQHRRWYLGLVGSILDSGDGETPATAFETISVTEEYVILGYLGLEPVGQSLVDGPQGESLDAIEVTAEGGGTRIVYFNSELHFARLSRALQSQQ